MDADALELSRPALIQARKRISDQNEPEVTLAGLVESGSRTIGKVAPAERHSRDVQPAQMLFKLGP